MVLHVLGAASRPVRLRSFIFITFVILCSFASVQPSNACDIDGVTNCAPGAAATFRFNPPTGSAVVDVEGRYTLQANDPSAFNFLPGGGIEITQSMILESVQPEENVPGGIHDQCVGKSGFTVEAWVQPASDESPEDQPSRIFTLSRNINSRSFLLGTRDDRYVLRLRTTGNGNNGNDPETQSNNGVVDPTRPQHIFATFQPGLAQLVVDNAFVGSVSFGGDMSNWDDRSILAIGDEVVDGTRAFHGKIFFLAVYCRTLSEQEMIGIPLTPNTPHVGWGTETPGELFWKQQAFSALTRLGVSTALDHPLNVAASRLMAEGRYTEAGLLATDLTQDEAYGTASESFYLNTIRTFAAEMIDGDRSAMFNDFIATFIGAVRDGTDLRRVLDGNFLYQVLGVPSLPTDPESLHTSNDHYVAAWDNKPLLDLLGSLARVDSQKMFVSGALVDHPDPGGVITSRAFQEAHSVAGTQRRPAEKLFENFACLKLSEYADNTVPGTFMRRDVDPAPGGSFANSSECRACHYMNDSHANAFVKYDFKDEQVLHTARHPAGNGNGRIPVDPTYPEVTYKSTRPDNVNNSSGHHPSNDSYVSMIPFSPVNSALFGLKPGTEAGVGVKDLTRMISESRRFPECMVMRSFEQICQQDASNLEPEALQALTTAFISGESENGIGGYNLRYLMSQVAMLNACVPGQ